MMRQCTAALFYLTALSEQVQKWGKSYVNIFNIKRDSVWENSSGSYHHILVMNLSGLTMHCPSPVCAWRMKARHSKALQWDLGPISEKNFIALLRNEMCPFTSSITCFSFSLGHETISLETPPYTYEGILEEFSHQSSIPQLFYRTRWCTPFLTLYKKAFYS